MGRVLPNDLGHFPVTYALIGINIVIYLLTALSSGNLIDIPSRELYAMGGVFGPAVVLGGEWYRVFFALFLHGGMTHLLMNMVSLYLVGRAIEHHFSIRGYLLIYFASGIIGAMTSLYFHPESVNIGASGAIFGIFGALIGFFLLYRERFRSQAQGFMKDIGVILGLNLFIGITIPSVDISAHIGGLIAGTIGGFLLARRDDLLWLFALITSLAVTILYFILTDHYMGLV